MHGIFLPISDLITDCLGHPPAGVQTRELRFLEKVGYYSG